MGGGSGPRRGGIIEGINVTPLVDITLVLMIVFIVTAKIMVTPAVPLDLPEASQSEDVQSVFAVAVDAQGALSIDDEPVTESQLSKRATRALEDDPQVRAIIQADGDAKHRRVIRVLDALKAVGLSRVAFGTVVASTPGTASPKTPEPEDAQATP